MGYDPQVYWTSMAFLLKDGISYVLFIDFWYMTLNLLILNSLYVPLEPSKFFILNNISSTNYNTEYETNSWIVAGKFLEVSQIFLNFLYWSTQSLFEVIV